MGCFLQWVVGSLIWHPGLGCLPEIGYFVPSSFRQSQAIFTLALRRWHWLEGTSCIHLWILESITNDIQWRMITTENCIKWIQQFDEWALTCVVESFRSSVGLRFSHLSETIPETHGFLEKAISSWLKFMGCFFPKLSNSVSVSWAIANFRSLKTWKDGQRRSWRVTMEEKKWIWWKQQIPSRGLTYPTLGKGKSSSKCHFWGIC